MAAKMALSTPDLEGLAGGATRREAPGAAKRGSQGSRPSEHPLSATALQDPSSHSAPLRRPPSINHSLWVKCTLTALVFHSMCNSSRFKIEDALLFLCGCEPRIRDPELLSCQATF